MTDEMVIKRKLLFDGEGVGDDRRINMVLKMITKWVLKESYSQEENEAMYNKILLQLCLIESARKKSELVRSRNNKQLQLYKNYYDETENNLKSIKEAINTSKIILTKVKYEKHQKLTYEMVVKDIVEYPSRRQTAKLVQQLQQNINNMKESQKRLKNEFIMWRKNFIIILTSANQMCTRLNEFIITDFK